MITVTLNLPDDVGPLIENAGDHLAELVASKLRQPEFPGYLYEPVLDFLASNPTPEQVRAFRAQDDVVKRFQELVAKDRENQITDAEKKELEAILKIERLIRLIKSNNLS